MSGGLFNRLFLRNIFHKVFTMPYVGSIHPLESNTLPVPQRAFFCLALNLFDKCCPTVANNEVEHAHVWTLSSLQHSISTLLIYIPIFEVFVMRFTLPALVLGLLVAQGAMAGDGTAAVGGGLGGALGNVVGQSMGGSTGAAIGAGVAGAAGSAVAAKKGHRTSAAIGGGVGAAGGSLIGNSLGGRAGSTIGAGLGGALGGGVGSNLANGHKRH
jgi:hypothetical protein